MPEINILDLLWPSINLFHPSAGRDVLTADWRTCDGISIRKEDVRNKNVPEKAQAVSYSYSAVRKNRGDSVGAARAAG